MPYQEGTPVYVEQSMTAGTIHNVYIGVDYAYDIVDEDGVISQAWHRDVEVLH